LKNSIVNKDFKIVLNNSKSLQVGDLLFYYDTKTKTGISFIVSRKTGNAIQRNKFKRRCRALYRRYNSNQLKGYTLIVRPIKKLKDHYSWKDLSLSFERFCIKLGL